MVTNEILTNIVLDGQPLSREVCSGSREQGFVGLPLMALNTSSPEAGVKPANMDVHVLAVAIRGVKGARQQGFVLVIYNLAFKTNTEAFQQ